VVATGTQNVLELLATKPSIHAIDVGFVDTESIAEIAAMDQDIAGKYAKLLVFSVSITYDYEPHSLWPPTGCMPDAAPHEAKSIGQ
jgi:hypothetical protein